MKTLLKIILGLVVLLIVALVAGYFFLGSIVKTGVEKVGPRVTKTDVKLKTATLSLFSGSGELKNFVVANPEGYKTPSAIQVGSVAVSVQPGSVMSGKVIVHSIKMIAPEITFEGTLSGNNLSKLLDNIKGSSEQDKQAPKEQKSSSKKLQVDDFLLTGAKVNLSTTLLGGRSATISIPEIHITNLGQGTDGITAAELAERVFSEITQKTIAAVTSEIGNLGKGATDLIKGAAGTNMAPTLDKATKGIGDLFKKK